MQPDWSDGSLLSSEDKNRLIGVGNYSKALITEFENQKNVHFGHLKELSKHLGSSCVVTGSAVSLSIIGDRAQASDIDIYPRDKVVFNTCLKWLRDPEGAKGPLRALQWLPDDSSEKSPVVTLTPYPGVGFSGNFKPLPIQLIRLFWWRSPLEVLSSFDLTLNQIGLVGNFIYYDQLGLKDLLNKEIRLQKAINVSKTLSRIKKYEKRGFMVDNELLGIKGDMIEESKSYAQKKAEKLMETVSGRAEYNDWPDKDAKARYYGYSNYKEMSQSLGLDE